MEKLCKNMFRMFRDETTTLEQVSKRFFVLKEKLDKLGDVYLDENYYREMKKYIDGLDWTLKGNFDLEKIRGINMTRLNRIQKVKNEGSYKKEKHNKKILE